MRPAVSLTVKFNPGGIGKLTAVISQDNREEILEDIRSQFQVKPVKNVNDRLKIYFGKTYGLHITSEPDVGTCVEIRMPKIQEGDYEAK